MKILIINTLFPPHKIGGAEKSVALLADGLACAGEDVAIATLDDIAEPSFERLFNGIAVHRLPMDNIYWPYNEDASRSAAQKLTWHMRNRWNRRAAKRIDQVIAKETPDVVHCNLITGFSPAIWEQVKKRNIPLVQTLRDYGLMCARSALFRNGQQCKSQCADCRFLTAPARQGSAKIDQLVSNSNYVIRAHKQAGYFPHVPARRIFNVVDAQASSLPPASVGSEPLVFGFIGRIEPEKGIEQVLTAMAKLKSDNWRLRIAGTGARDYIDELRQRYDRANIAWLGYCETAEFYRSIDVALISSVWPEPLPRTLIEALGYGRATICSDAGGIPEIAELGRRSVTYPAEDVEALHSILASALEHADEWRRGGVMESDALSAFQEANVIAAYREVYRDAVTK